MRGEPPQSSYTFKHTLIQEAAYESLLKRTRRQLHGRVVEVLLAQFPERAAAEPEVIARHAELAGQTDEATKYYAARPARRRKRARRTVRLSRNFAKRLHCSRRSPKAHNETPTRWRSSFCSVGHLSPTEALRTPKLRLLTRERGFCARPWAMPGGLASPNLVSHTSTTTAATSSAAERCQLKCSPWRKHRVRRRSWPRLTKTSLQARSTTRAKFASIADAL